MATLEALTRGLNSWDEVIDTGPIQNDPGDPPYDQWTESVVYPCGGYSSCY